VRDGVAPKGKKALGQRVWTGTQGVIAIPIAGMESATAAASWRTRYVPLLRSGIVSRLGNTRVIEGEQARELILNERRWT
jgi:hypothetical protein